jgi:hypothetical protein
MLNDEVSTSFDDKRQNMQTPINTDKTKPGESNMQVAADQLAQWSTESWMVVNSKKTKEMLFVSSAAHAMPCIRLNNESIERVVTIIHDLTWANHITAVCSKASKQLHFLTILRRAAVSRTYMLYYYTTVTRPVMEYACPL